MKVLLVLFLPCLIFAEFNETRLHNVGTVLFTMADLNRECWSSEEIALLTARKLFRSLMPSIDTMHADDDLFVTDVIDYFRTLLEVIRENVNGKTKHILLMALTDTLGGYMRHFILPITKYAFYAGNIEYMSVIKLYQLYDELKNYLHTNGHTWAKSWKKAPGHIVAKPIVLQPPAPNTNPCKGIIYYRNSVSKSKPMQEKFSMQVALPFFDSKSHPSAIAVPFRTFGLRNVEARVSSYILVKYYVAAMKCMASKNTDETDVRIFNNKMLGFITNKVVPHLCDDKFYAAFGGILRLLQTIKQYEIKKAEVLGNFNGLPELEDKEAYPSMDEKELEEEAQRKPLIGGGLVEPNKPKSNLILLAALVTIVVWFCLGAAFVCCRIRVSKNKKEDKEIGNNKTESGCTIKSASRISNLPCTTEICPEKGYSRSSIGEDVSARKRNTSKSSSNNFTSQNATSDLDEEEDTDKSYERDEVKPAQLQVQSLHSVHYFPPKYACHTSMTGKVRMDSSTEEYTSRDEHKPPYLFGYDIHTTSEETTPRETSDGENEIGGGNLSK